MIKPTITDNLFESYKEQKQILIDKYEKQLYSSLSEIRQNIVEKTTLILGNEFFDVFDKNEQLKKEINAKKREFYKTTQYRAKQKELSDLKSQLNKASSQAEKDEITKEMNKAISQITTLNVTINNRLKSLIDESKVKTDYIKSTIDKNMNSILELKNDVVSEVKSIVGLCVKNYTKEVMALAKDFNQDDKNIELPFDKESMKIDFPIFIKPDDESLTNVNDGQTFISSDNKDKTLN